MHLEAVPDAHRPEGASGDLYMHVGAGPHIHRPEGVGRNPYVHVRAGPGEFFFATTLYLVIFQK